MSEVTPANREIGNMSLHAWHSQEKQCRSIVSQSSNFNPRSAKSSNFNPRSAKSSNFNPRSTFLHQVKDDVFGVDVDHDQSPKSDSRLLGQLAADQRHDIGQLIL